MFKKKRNKRKKIFPETRKKRREKNKSIKLLSPFFFFRFFTKFYDQRKRQKNFFCFVYKLSNPNKWEGKIFESANISFLGEFLNE